MVSTVSLTFNVYRRREPDSDGDRDKIKGGVEDQVRVTIKKLDKTARDLTRLVKENVTTKREIKDLSTTIRSLSSSLCTKDVQELLRRVGAPPNTKALSNVVSTGTQYRSPEEERVDRQCAEMRAGLVSRDPEKVARATAKEWPEQMYEKTTLVRKKSEW